MTVVIVNIFIAAGLSPLLGKLLASTDATMDQAVIILPELEMGKFRVHGGTFLGKLVKLTDLNDFSNNTGVSRKNYFSSSGKCN